jgi:hypothetical protein
VTLVLPPPKRPVGPYATPDAQQLWAYDLLEWAAKRLVEHMTTTDQEFQNLDDMVSSLRDTVTGLDGKIDDLVAADDNVIAVLDQLRAQLQTQLTPQQQANLDSALQQATAARDALVNDVTRVGDLTSQMIAAGGPTTPPTGTTPPGQTMPPQSALAQADLVPTEDHSTLLPHASGSTMPSEPAQPVAGGAPPAQPQSEPQNQEIGAPTLDKEPPNTTS